MIVHFVIHSLLVHPLELLLVIVPTILLIHRLLVDNNNDAKGSNTNSPTCTVSDETDTAPTSSHSHNTKSILDAHDDEEDESTEEKLVDPTPSTPKFSGKTSLKLNLEKVTAACVEEGSAQSATVSSSRLSTSRGNSSGSRSRRSSRGEPPLSGRRLIARYQRRLLQQTPRDETQIRVHNFVKGCIRMVQQRHDVSTFVSQCVQNVIDHYDRLEKEQTEKEVSSFVNQCLQNVKYDVEVRPQISSFVSHCMRSVIEKNEIAHWVTNRINSVQQQVDIQRQIRLFVNRCLYNVFVEDPSLELSHFVQTCIRNALFKYQDNRSNSNSRSLQRKESFKNRFCTCRNGQVINLVSEVADCNELSSSNKVQDLFSRFSFENQSDEEEYYGVEDDVQFVDDEDNPLFRYGELGKGYTRNRNPIKRVKNIVRAKLDEYSWIGI